MTTRRFLVYGTFLAILAAAGCDNSSAEPKVKSPENAPKLQPMTPAGPPGPAGAGKPSGPTTAPQ